MAQWHISHFAYSLLWYCSSWVVTRERAFENRDVLPNSIELFQVREARRGEVQKKRSIYFCTAQLIVDECCIIYVKHLVRVIDSTMHLELATTRFPSTWKCFVVAVESIAIITILATTLAVGVTQMSSQNKRFAAANNRTVDVVGEKKERKNWHQHTYGRFNEGNNRNNSFSISEFQDIYFRQFWILWRNLPALSRVESRNCSFFVMLNNVRSYVIRRLLGILAYICKHSIARHRAVRASSATRYATCVMVRCWKSTHQAST